MRRKEGEHFFCRMPRLRLAKFVVEALLNEYSARFAHDFLAVLPPRDKPAP